MPEENKLLTLNQMGLIPGPGEEKEAFFLRADYCQDLQDQLPEEIKAHLPNHVFSHQSKEFHILNESAENLKKQYDCSPGWVPLFFSNYKLPFWHGGCAWIFQMTEQSPTSALIQLRQNFNTSTKYLGIYDRNELLTHELSHIGRMMFQEPKFEELLAYRTSNSKFRRWFGPIVQSSTESALFVLLLFVLIVFDFFLVALDRPDAFSLALWLKAIPIGIIFAALFRLWKRQTTYKRCLKNLEGCIGHADAVAYRLTDHEIELFSKLSGKEIQDYAHAKAKEELRWQVIKKAYMDGQEKNHGGC
jgi:hypothetical protein